MSFYHFSEYQCSALESIRIDPDKSFGECSETAVYWLSGAGVLINSHGTVLIFDPVLTVTSTDPYLSEIHTRFFEDVEQYPLMVLPPIEAKDIPCADAVLYTHVDDDHMGRLTVSTLNQKGFHFYGTRFTCQKLQYLGVPSDRLHSFRIDEAFEIGTVSVRPTPCRHDWQTGRPNFLWHYGEEDCCGYLICSEDGTIWLPGDTELLEEHCRLSDPDMIFFDVSDDPSHFTAKNAAVIFNTYKDARKILYHYGTLYSPRELAHNGNPAAVKELLERPEMLSIVAPGEKIIL